ncbi:10372_t:CDS:1, partial [Cetraspora pellucida]
FFIVKNKKNVTASVLKPWHGALSILNSCILFTTIHHNLEKHHRRLSVTWKERSCYTYHGHDALSIPTIYI